MHTGKGYPHHGIAWYLLYSHQLWNVLYIVMLLSMPRVGSTVYSLWVCLWHRHVCVSLWCSVDVPGVSWCNLCVCCPLLGAWPVFGPILPSVPVWWPLPHIIILSATLPAPFHRKRLSRSDPTLDQFDSCARSSVYNTHVLGHQEQACVSASSLPAILHDEQGLSLVSASLVFAGMLLHMTNSLYYSGAALHVSQSKLANTECFNKEWVYNYFQSHSEQLMKGISSELWQLHTLPYELAVRDWSAIRSIVSLFTAQEIWCMPVIVDIT